MTQKKIATACVYPRRHRPRLSEPAQPRGVTRGSWFFMLMVRPSSGRSAGPSDTEICCRPLRPSSGDRSRKPPASPASSSFEDAVHFAHEPPPREVVHLGPAQQPRLLPAGLKVAVVGVVALHLDVDPGLVRGAPELRLGPRVPPQLPDHPGPAPGAEHDGSAAAEAEGEEGEGGGAVGRGAPLPPPSRPGGVCVLAAWSGPVGLGAEGLSGNRSGPPLGQTKHDHGRGLCPATRRGRRPTADAERRRDRRHPALVALVYSYIIFVYYYYITILY